MVNQQLMRLSAETGIELVATNDIHYTYAEDADSHDILLCLQTGKKITDEDRMRYEGGQYFVKSEAEMASLFPYAPQAIENTQKIADRCNVEIEFGVTKLPKFDVPEGYTSWEYLNKLCYDGLEERYHPATDDIAALEEKIASIDDQMMKNATNSAKLAELMAQKEETEAALEEKTERWVYLTDLAERIEEQNQK